jgi:hypothetical protein
MAVLVKHSNSDVVPSPKQLTSPSESCRENALPHIAGPNHPHIARNLRGITVKSRPADWAYRVRKHANVFKWWSRLGATPAVCVPRPLSSVGPSTFRLDADHPRTQLSAASATAVVCSPTVAAAPGSRALTGSAPRILAGSASGPEDRPRSDRPAIRRTMPDGLTGPPKKGVPIVVQ